VHETPTPLYPWHKPSYFSVSRMFKVHIQVDQITHENMLGMQFMPRQLHFPFSYSVEVLLMH